MDRLVNLSKLHLESLKFREYKEAHFTGEYGCSHCSKALKHIFVVEDSEGNIAYLGSECVKKISKEQNKNTFEGITNIPKSKRKQVKVNKDKLELEEFNNGIPF